MSPVYKKIDITGTSEKSIEEAINQAIMKASESVRQMRWFEVTETRGVIEGNHVKEWQVSLKIGFTIED